MIVTGVRHEVDPDFTTQTLDQVASGCRSAQDPAHPVEELSGSLRPHPIAQVQLVARRRHSQKVSQVAGQSRHAEPTDRERLVRAAVEAAESCWLSPGLDQQEIEHSFIPLVL